MILLLIVFALCVLLVLKAGGFPLLQEIKTSSLLLSSAFAVLVALLWRLQRDKTSTYDALDMLMDGGRASLEAHITLVMAALAAWWIVTQTLAGKDVSERLIDVLMIFVIYRGAKKAIDAYGNKVTSPPPNQEIEQQVLVSPRAPVAPPPEDVRPVKGAAMSKRSK